MEEDFNMGGNNMNNDSKNMGVFGTNNSGFNEKPKGNIGTVLGIINLVLVVILSAGLIYVVSTTNTSGLQKTVKEQKDKIETLEAKISSIESTIASKNNQSGDNDSNSSGDTSKEKNKLPFTEGSKALLEVAADYKKNTSTFIDSNGQFSVDTFTKTFKGKSSLKDTESLGTWNVTVTPKSEISVELQPSATNTSNKKIRYIVTVSKTELGVYAVTTDASGKEERIKVEEDNSPANVTTPGTEKPSTGSSEGGNTSNPSNTNNSGNTNNGNGSNTTGNTSGTGSAASSNNKPSGGLDGAVSNLNRSSNN